MRVLFRAILSGLTAFIIGFIIIMFAPKYPLTTFVLGLVGLGILANIDDWNAWMYKKSNKHIL